MAFIIKQGCRMTQMLRAVYKLNPLALRQVIWPRLTRSIAAVSMHLSLKSIRQQACPR